ncbi:hypothetical protein GIB67_005602 [Kingdonia uniflora]|uniref:Transposase n=1 Tax=Kingdonia uniflora TaxID=39325 RepID=A0A7J7NHS4_9MAGN|nr:hypothetical protein GIB67_005602 [Kingdonia uniflora]
MQEACRKDVERAFGVLQARFQILAHDTRFWKPRDLTNVMYACIIMHNMIDDNERHTCIQQVDIDPEFRDSVKNWKKDLNPRHTINTMAQNIKKIHEIVIEAFPRKLVIDGQHSRGRAPTPLGLDFGGMRSLKNKEDLLLLIPRCLKKNSNLLIDGLGISEIPHRTASPGNIASYMKLSEVDSMYLPVPVNFIFIGFEGKGNQEFKLGSQELERWFTKIDHIFEHTRIPHIGETLSPFYKVAIDKAHRHHLHIVSPINYNFSVHAVQMGEKVTSVFQHAIKVLSRRENISDTRDDENVLWQVDADMMEVLCTSLVEYLEIEDAYNILILNPNHDIKRQKYGYRRGLSESEISFLTEVEWSNICLDSLNNVEKLYQGKQIADILHSKIVQNGDAEEGKTIRGQYEGPDQDLADMLERDVLETSLGIRWDDVAGLTEAKRL